MLLVSPDGCFAFEDTPFGVPSEKQVFDSQALNFAPWNVVTQEGMALRKRSPA